MLQRHLCSFLCRGRCRQDLTSATQGRGFGQRSFALSKPQVLCRRLGRDCPPPPFRDTKTLCRSASKALNRNVSFGYLRQAKSSRLRVSASYGETKRLGGVKTTCARLGNHFFGIPTLIGQLDFGNSLYVLLKCGSR